MESVGAKSSKQSEAIKLVVEWRGVGSSGMNAARQRMRGGSLVWACEKMASAKFLEEALSTDVDESAVNAIVGSLETQLVTSAPSASGQQAQPSQQNHHVISSGIANGATIGAAAAQPKPQKVANGSPPEVSKQQQLVNPTTSAPTTTTVVKTEQQQVKIIYPQVIAGSGVINASNKIAFPAQTVSQLANGAINIAGPTTSNVATVVQSNSTTLVNKPAALVIKTSGAPSGMVSVPMSVPVSVAANAANTLQNKTCSTSTIVPNSVQILNVNPMRPATPVAGQQQNKQVAPRVVIGQHMVNTRPGTPGVRLRRLFCIVLFCFCCDFDFANDYLFSW